MDLLSSILVVTNLLFFLFKISYGVLDSITPAQRLSDGDTIVSREGNFDYPSNTILPGMKHGWDLKRGLNRRLIAWKNWDGPSPVNFIFEITLHNYPETYLRRGSTIYFRAGPWNGYGFSGSPGLKPNPVYAFKFVFNQEHFPTKLTLCFNASHGQNKVGSFLYLCL